jgi:hypothetical protein
MRFKPALTFPGFVILVSMILYPGSAAFAKAQNVSPSNTEESWTAARQVSVDNTNPLRTTESHSSSGNRSVDKLKTEVLGPDGRYQAETESDTETIRIDPTTTRTTVRMYRWDANGSRNLVQLTEEEANTSASGDTHVVRTNSSTDVNGNLQLVQREIADTKKTGSDAQETKTKVYFSDGNGVFTPSRQTQELQRRTSDNGTEVEKTTLVPDTNGNWQLLEVTKKTIKEDGKKQTSDESVSRPDLEGRLSEVSRTVGEETETAPGERTSTTETYSVEASGVPVDGGLHLSQRLTTVQKNDSDKKTTEQKVEQPNVGNPNDGLQLNGKNKYTVKYAPAGTLQTKTIQVRGPNGTFTVFSADTQKSDQHPAVPATTPSSDNTK